MTSPAAHRQSAINDFLIGLRRVAVLGFASGAGAIVTAALALSVIHWYRGRPESWQTRTIAGVIATASQRFTYNSKTGENTQVGFTFNFVVENKSWHDYTIPEDLKLFKRDKRSQALVEFPAKLDHSYVVLAKDRAEIPVRVDYTCSSIDGDTGQHAVPDVRRCFEDAVADASGFVALDYNSKIKLELPNPVLVIDHAHNEQRQADMIAEPMAPDVGGPFEQAAACYQAEQLIPECKTKGYASDKPWVNYGGFSKPLPSLPTPPAGYNLDASPEVCKIAVEWQNFCRRQK